MVEVPKETIENIYKLVESVKIDGKLRKGTNETTKAIEKGEAQLVIAAEDINPKEIVMHFPVLCKEKNIPFVHVPSKSELGAAAGLPVSTSSIAIVNPGEAKKQLFGILKDLETLEKGLAKPVEEKPKVEENKKEAPKEEVKKEAPVEEKPKEEPTVEDAPVEEPKEEEAPKEEEKPTTEETSAEPKGVKEPKEEK